MERLFDIDEIPEIPLLREARRSRGENDARFRNDYPADWHRCGVCEGRGFLSELPTGEPFLCEDCLGMGSLKARYRLEAGHRCVRCGHPYVPKGDAERLNYRRYLLNLDGGPVEPTPYHWSPCDERCTHLGPVRFRELHRGDGAWEEADLDACGYAAGDHIYDEGPGGQRLRRWEVEAEWRILTCHHLDGDKANCRWWNIAVLDQRCHLEIQAKVVMERVYPHEHSSWFKPFAAAYYAWVYLGEDLTRDETVARLDELLALERVA